AAEMDVERAQRGHDDEVRKDERPAAGPGPPEAAADVRDPDADLDRERAGQGLADGDPFAHLLLAEPFLFADHFALHLSDERDGVWRKLQRMGAVRLRGAGWILPETPETTELFQWLVQEIQSFRGEATLLRVDRVETMTDDEIAALFHKVRNPEYQAVVHRCR